MKVYLDIVFVINFGINFIYSYLILCLFNEKASILKLSLSSFIAGSIMVFMLFDIIIYNVFKICGGAILTFIGMGGHRYILKTSMYYLLYFSLTGLVQSFEVRNLYLIIAILIIIILIILENFRRKVINHSHLKYNISVNFKTILLKMNGFLDTGNMAVYNNVPIIFVDEKYYSDGFNKIGEIVVNTVNGDKIIDIYEPDSFIIVKSKKMVKMEVYIAFSKLNPDIECLLNYHIIF